MDWMVGTKRGRGGGKVVNYAETAAGAWSSNKNRDGVAHEWVSDFQIWFGHNSRSAGQGGER